MDQLIKSTNRCSSTIKVVQYFKDALLMYCTYWPETETKRYSFNYVKSRLLWTVIRNFIKYRNCPFQKDTDCKVKYHQQRSVWHPKIQRILQIKPQGCICSQRRSGVANWLSKDLPPCISTVVATGGRKDMFT